MDLLCSEKGSAVSQRSRLGRAGGDPFVPVGLDLGLGVMASAKIKQGPRIVIQAGAGVASRCGRQRQRRPSGLLAPSPFICPTRLRERLCQDWGAAMPMLQLLAADRASHRVQSG
nr:hypothetical protein GCM10020063_092360 [Dactylosporangium thailandense]